MSRVLLLITLLVALSSCDSDLPPSYQESVQIRVVDWFPGDTLVGALVSVPDATGNRSTMFRIYDLAGSIRQEFFVTNDNYPRDLHITQDGQHAVFSSNGSISVLNISTQSPSIASSSTRLISAAPDKDVYLLSRTEDNPNFNSTEVYARAKFDGSSLVIDTFLRITTSGFGFTGEFPLLLAGGRVASLEFETGGGSIMKIRDSLFAVTNTFHLPTSLFFMNIEVPRSDSSFYFVASAMTAELSRFRTDVGFIDPIEEIYDNSSDYAVLSTEKKVIFKRKLNDNFLIKDVSTGAETVIPHTESGIGVFLSPNDKLLAVVHGGGDGHTLEIVALP